MQEYRDGGWYKNVSFLQIQSTLQILDTACVPNLYLGTDAVPSPGGLEVPDVLADHVLPPVPQDLLRRVVTPHNLLNDKYFFSPTKIFLVQYFSGQKTQTDQEDIREVHTRRKRRQKWWTKHTKDSP